MLKVGAEETLPLMDNNPENTLEIHMNSHVFCHHNWAFQNTH